MRAQLSSRKQGMSPWLGKGLSYIDSVWYGKHELYFSNGGKYIAGVPVLQLFGTYPKHLRKLMFQEQGLFNFFYYGNSKHKSID